MTAHLTSQMTMTSVSPAVDGPLAVLSVVAENTSLHGVPNAYRARCKIRKAIWSVLFISGFGKSMNRCDIFTHIITHIHIYTYSTDIHTKIHSNNSLTYQYEAKFNRSHSQNDRESIPTKGRQGVMMLPQLLPSTQYRLRHNIWIL